MTIAITSDKFCNGSVKYKKDHSEFTTFVKGVSWEELDQDKCGLAAGTTERPRDSGRPRSVRTSEFRKTSNLWRSSYAVMKVLCTPRKVRTKLKGRRTFYLIALSSVGRFAKHDLANKNLWRLPEAFARWCHFNVKDFFK